jgi:phosphatidylglycerophosphate synthase
VARIPGVTRADPLLPVPVPLRGPTPADLVTAFRGGLVVVVAVLVVTGLLTDGPTRSWWVAWIGVAAWALDSLDGYVARRTGTASDRGALLDSGVDGSLVLVLSLAFVGVAPWALAGGLLWPAFLAVQAVRPAWRRTLPHSARRKVAGGTLTGTLAIAAAPFWPEPAVQVAVGVAVLLVGWSFAVDVRWLERAAAVAPRARAS